MVWIARLLVLLFGILFISIGLTALLNPDTIMANFSLASIGPEGQFDETGRNTIRADMGAFFIGAALAAFAGLIPGQKQWLLGAIALCGIAFLGRLFGIFLTGPTPAIIQFMLTEAVALGILIFAYVVLGRKTETQAAASSYSSQNGSSVETDSVIK